MISLSTDEKRNLQFDVTIEGIDYKKLKGTLTFEVENVMYGFPVRIIADHIDVEVPPLGNIIKKGLKDDSIIECKLDIFGNGFYLNPWNGKFKLKTPVRMEARMNMMDDVPYDVPYDDPKPQVHDSEKSIVATLKDQNQKVIEEKYEPVAEYDDRKDVLSKDVIDRDDLLNELFKKVEKHLLNNKVNDVPNLIKNKTTELIHDVKQNIPNKNEKTSHSVLESKLNKMNNVVEKFLKNTNSPVRKLKNTKSIKEQINKSSHKSSHKSSLLDDYGTSLKKQVKKIQVFNEQDNGDPITLMESFGMRNPKIQNMMIEKAKGMGSDDNVYGTLKNMLSSQRMETPFESYIKNKAENVS